MSLTDNNQQELKTLLEARIIVRYLEPLKQ